MKILQILHTFPPESMGGTELYTQSLAEELAQKHELMIIHTRKPTSKNDVHLNTTNIFSNKIILKSLPQIKPKNYVSTYFNPSLDNKTIGIIKEFSPDIIHIEHLIHHSISIIDEISALSIPMVFTIHDYWYICPQCFLTKSNGCLCEGPQGGTNCISSECGDGNRYILLSHAISSNPLVIALITFSKKITSNFLRKKFRVLFQNKLKDSHGRPRGFTETKKRLQRMVQGLNKASLIISPSKLLADRYKKEGIKNVTVVPHGIRGISKNYLNQEKYNAITTRKIIFAYFGSISEHKGIHILIKAFNTIKSDNTELWIFGKFGQYPEYEKELLRIKKNPHIKFKGFIEHKKIYETLMTIDVVVIPSICAENFPLIANEAFLAKTPVIASNVGGLNEIVDNGVSGFIFEKSNENELSEIIMRIIQNPEMLKNFSQNIPKIKTMSEHAREIELLYNQVLKTNQCNIKKH